jgi:D-threonate/D-erythronate kinase
MKPFLGLIADDFTGALDSGAQFARFGLSAYLRLRGTGAAQVEIISTVSRELPEPEAAQRCREAANRLAGRRLFKKIDSTLRGHVGAEIEALLEASGYTKAVVCPAAPGQGRSVRGGRVYVNGVPLAETAFKDDPTYPARSSQLAELIRRPAAHLDLATVRLPPAELEGAIAAAGERIVSADAETEDDLTAISRAVVQGGYLPCGAFGLARAWVQEVCGCPPLATLSPLPLGQPTVFNRWKGAALAVVGSGHPTSRAQVEAFDREPEGRVWAISTHMSAWDETRLAQQLYFAWPAAGARVIWPDQASVSPDQTWQEIITRLTSAAAALLSRIRPAFLVIVGGETASSLCDRLGVEAVEVLGEVEPGIPWGRLVGGRLDGMPIITKAGGFGTRNTLVRILFPETGESLSYS